LKNKIKRDILRKMIEKQGKQERFKKKQAFYDMKINMIGYRAILKNNKHLLR
jgi:hypothetical protein